MRGRQSDGSICRKCFRDEIPFLAQQLENGIDAGQSSTARIHGASASAGHSSKFADFILMHKAFLVNAVSGGKTSRLPLITVKLPVASQADLTIEPNSSSLNTAVHH
jgi:hypothetical protein